jgi:hypothetical protein
MTSISIICPLFNEANNLNKLFVDLDYLNRIFNKNKVKVNFILINDCSYDDSKNIISQSLPSYPQLDIELINNLQNIGFADSVKKGFNSSTSEYLMILPGDAEVDVESISDFNLQGNDLIFFERINMKSRPLFRILISHLYRIFISLIFLNRIEDYNGIFILKRDVYKKIGIDANSFFINAEVIIKCRKIKAKISKGTFSLHSKDIYKSTSLNFKQLKGVVRNITNLMHFKS